jgi:hypothetical protein
MPDIVRSGYRRQHRYDIAAELRILELKDEVADLSRGLVRLRAAVREHLERPSHSSLERLRYELSGHRLRAERVA